MEENIKEQGKERKTIELFALREVLKMKMMMIIAENLLQYNYKSTD